LQNITSDRYREFKNSVEPYCAPTNVNPIQFVDKPLTITSNSKNETISSLYINFVYEKQYRNLSPMMQNQSKTVISNEELQDL